jgi:hypothetical protein
LAAAGAHRSRPIDGSGADVDKQFGVTGKDRTRDADADLGGL